MLAATRGSSTAAMTSPWRPPASQSWRPLLVDTCSGIITVLLLLVRREQQQGAVAVRVSPGRGAGGGAGHRGQQAGRGRGLLDQHLLQVAAAVIHP